MNKIRADLKILCYLPYLLDECSVSGAAKKANISQPMMSHALKEMRAIFKDPMFIQQGKKLIPTDRAIYIGKMLIKGLNFIEQAYSPQIFNPEKDDAHFSISAPDFLNYKILLPLTLELSEKYPNISLNIKPLKGNTFMEGLEKNHIDLAIGEFEESNENLKEHLLYYLDEFVCITRKNHPKFKEKLTLKTYLTLKHIMLGQEDEAIGFANRELRRKNLKREATYTTPYFPLVMSLVARTDAVYTTSKITALHYAKAMSFDIHELPLNIPKIPVKMIWHPRKDSSSKQIWLREKIKKIIQNTTL